MMRLCSSASAYRLARLNSEKAKPLPKQLKTMKQFFFLTLLLLPALLAAQTCDYDKLYREGKTFAKQRQYKKALYKYNSARRCDPAKGETVDAAIEALLDLVEAEKNAADNERKRAEEEQKKAESERKISTKARGDIRKALDDVKTQKKQTEEVLATAKFALEELEKQQEKNKKIIGAFYFYAGRFALAFKDEKYGFIDKEGNERIKYQFDEATPFDKTGYAIVKEILKDKNNNDSLKIAYLIDTLGKRFYLTTKISKRDTSISALRACSGILKWGPGLSLE